MSRRQTVISKKGKAYKYRRVDETHKRIRVKSGYGYDDGSMTKIAFKNGNLTVAGEMFKESINEIRDKEEREKTLYEFDKYVKARSKSGLTTTIASFESHMIKTAYKRWLNNLNIDTKDVVMKLKQEKGLSEEEALAIVSDYYELNKYITWTYEDGWEIA